MARTLPVCVLIATFALVGCSAELEAPAAEADIPWSAEDLALSGPPGDADMCRPPAIVPGEVFTYRVTGADPGTRVWFMRGNSESEGASCPGGIGTCLDLDVARLLGVAFSDAHGVASLTLVAPPDLPIGANVAVQAVFYQDSDYVTSNVTQAAIAESAEPSCAPDVCDPDPRACACADPAAPGEDFDNDMFGCAGTVLWADRAASCGEGYHVCDAAEWLANRGDGVPFHHYWTDDALDFDGVADACSVSHDEVHVACADEPMRVCASGPTFANTDPLGNDCNWSDCGFESTEVNDYFGGCDHNPTAGVLCCAD